MATTVPGPGPNERRGPLERFLGIFTDVRSGEAPTALLLMLTVFLLLLAYYLIKPVRESLLLQGGTTDIFGWTVGKPEIKRYSAALTATILILVVRYYGKLASAVPRHKLITFVTLFFISNLLVFFVLVQGTVTVWLGIAFFVWISIFNNMVVAQFWAFTNDVYFPDQGKRLFPLVGFGASLGAAGGSWLAGKLVRKGGEPPMLLVSGVILGVCLLLTLIVHRREAARRAALAHVAPQATEAEKPVPPGGGFQLVLSHRYLLYIALLVLFANIVNSTGEFILDKKLTASAAEAIRSGTLGELTERQWIGAFYASYQLWTNILGVLIQLFIVSRILKYAGVRAALFVLPVVAFCGYGVLAFGAAIGLVRGVKILENATDYSLQNTTKNALFLPTTREMKYKAKAAIDTFFVRTGDFAGALLVLAGTALALSVEQFALVNVLLVAVWILLAVGVSRQHKSLTSPEPVVAPVAAQPAQARG